MERGSKNYYSIIQGEDYISHKRFDRFKKWILDGENRNDYLQLPRITPENIFHFPEGCHWCIYLIYNGKLCVTVCFYNTFSRNFEIADSLIEEDYRDFRNPVGMICDWKNKKEYTLEQWIFSRSGQQFTGDKDIYRNAE